MTCPDCNRQMSPASVGNFKWVCVCGHRDGLSTTAVEHSEGIMVRQEPPVDHYLYIGYEGSPAAVEAFLAVHRRPTADSTQESPTGPQEGK